MARNNAQAQTAGTSAQNFSNQLQGQSGNVYSDLAPELESEVAHPPGYSPADLGAMNTAAQETAGGTQAGATGQGALLASRTRNPGTADAAIEASARDAGRSLGTASVGIQSKNADLKAKQQQAGLGELGDLYKTSTGDANEALGVVPQAVNADTNAVNSTYDWATDVFNPILNAASKAVSPIKFGG